MLHTLLSIVVAVLILTTVTSYVILRKAVSEPSFRKVLLLLVVMTPVLTLYAFAKSLFIHPKPIRYIDELGRIEDEIESERARSFDAKVVHPSFSSRWRMAYLYAVEKSAVAVSKLDPSLNATLCAGISRLR